MNTDFHFCIFSKQSIQNLSEKTFCYGIHRDGNYIYIGKTNCGLQRFKEHKLIEDTDMIHIWIPINRDCVGKLESKLIKMFKPTFNNRHK